MAPSASASLQRFCDEICRRNYGVVTRRELEEGGASKDFVQHRLETGRLRKLYPGVYADASVPDSLEQRVLAAVRWAGPGSVASHETAAVLLRIPAPHCGSIHITLTGGRPRNRSGIKLHRTQVLEAIDTSAAKGIPVTSAARTLLDLCGMVSEEAADVAFDDVIRRGLASPARLRWYAQFRCGSGTRGSTLFKKMMLRRPKGYRVTESSLEMKFLTHLRRRGFPAPVRQYEIRTGTKKIRVDFAYPEARVLIEVDSFRYHGGHHPWLRDVAKRNQVTGQGWTVLVAAEDDIDGGSTAVLAVLEQFRGTLLDLQPTNVPKNSRERRSSRSESAQRARS